MRTATECSPRRGERDSRYYEQVAAYYDFDSRNFEERAKQNAVLGRIRQEFRNASAPFVKGNVLEIGCGPGLDLVYWAQLEPNAQVYGLDVSPGMLRHAQKNIVRAGLTNAHTALGTIEDVEALFAGVHFDFAFCYFGALNTTEDLNAAAVALHRVLQPEGTAVLTFVNRWYAFEMLWSFLTAKWRRAFARLRPVWGGYATGRSLESRCYSPRQIRECFGSHFEIGETRGYSILYPAWYRYDRWVKPWPRLSETLWTFDRCLNLTPCWRFGEYALYILKLRPPERS
jgi:SAM-dependent methyltransferase